MGRLFGLVAILVALYVGMSIYTEGLDRALGGVLAPLQPVSRREAPLASHLTPGAQLADSPNVTRGSRPRPTDAIRERVTSDLRDGAQRRGY
jgi:hypothetical protein